MKKGLHSINNYFFKKKRLELGLTQQELANKLECSISTIQKIEQDYNYFFNCKFCFIIMYLNFLGINNISFCSYYGRDINIYTK